MKRYWEYVKEYQEVTENAKTDDHVVMPEIWIGFKFLDDNGIDEPWKPDERARLKKILDKYGPTERALFVRAILSTFDAVMGRGESYPEYAE